MTDKDKRDIAKELFAKTRLTKNQYNTFKGLAEDLDLRLVPDWDEVSNDYTK